MAAGSIVIDLLMKTGSFETDTKRAEKRLAEFKKEAIELGKQIGIAFTVAGTAVAALTKQAIDSADQMGDFAQKAGVSTEALSALAYAARFGDVSIEEVGKALNKLTADASSGGEKLSALGIALTDVGGRAKTADRLLLDVAETFAKMPDGLSKTNAAIELFGEKIGPELIPFLNQGREGIQALTEEAQRFGVVISGETAAAAGAFNDNLDRLTVAAQGFGLAVAKELLPTLTALTDELLRQDGAFSAAEVAGAAFRVVLEAISVLAANVIFVFQAVGREIGGIAAQLVALARLDIKGFKAISEAIREDASRARAELDAFEQRVLQVTSKATFAFQNVAGGGRGVAADPRIIGRTPANETVGFRALPPARPILPRQSGRPTAAKGPDFSAQDAEIDRISKQFEALDEARLAKQKAIQDEAARIYEQTRTPLELLNREEARLLELVNMGAISWDTYSRAIFAANDGVKQATTELDDFSKEAAKNIQDSLGDGLADILDGNFKNIGDNFKKLIDRMVSEAIAANIARALFGGAAEGGSGSGFLGTALSFVGSALGFGGAKAGGGDVMSGRSYLVGEQGPETFVPRTAGTIVPAMATAGGGQTFQVSQTFTVGNNVDRRTQMQIATDAQRGLQAAARNL